MIPYTFQGFKLPPYSLSQWRNLTLPEAMILREMVQNAWETYGPLHVFTVPRNSLDSLHCRLNKTNRSYVMNQLTTVQRVRDIDSATLFEDLLKDIRGELADLANHFTFHSGFSWMEPPCIVVYREDLKIHTFIYATVVEPANVTEPPQPAEQITFLGIHVPQSAEHIDLKLGFDIGNLPTQ